jgi:hypothetical protein
MWAIANRCEDAILCYYGSRSLWGRGHVPFEIAFGRIDAYVPRLSRPKFRAILKRYEGLFWNLQRSPSGEILIISVRSIERLAKELFCGEQLHGYRAELPESASSISNLRMMLLGGVFKNAGTQLPWNMLQRATKRSRNTIKKYLRAAGVEITPTFYLTSNYRPEAGKITFRRRMGERVVECHQGPNILGRRIGSNHSFNRRLNKGQAANTVRPRPEMTSKKIDVAGLGIINDCYYRNPILKELFEARRHPAEGQ